MNAEVMARLLRTILQVVGTYFAASGKITDGDWQAISGAVVALVTTGYTVYTSWGTIKVPDPLPGGTKLQVNPFTVLAAGALALMLAGCNTTGGLGAQQVITTAENALQATCTAYPIADAAFVTIVAATPPGKIPPKVVTAEKAAVAGLAAICAAPPKDASTAVIAAANAYKAVMQAIADARSAQGG